MWKLIHRLAGLALVAFASLAILPVLSAPAAASSSCLPSSLKSALAQINANFGPVKVISAHRPGARIAGSGKQSYHATCRAVDFHPPAGKYSAVVAWLAANHNGGLGTYSGRHSHIHIDNGPRYRFHKGGGSSKKRYVSARKAKQS